MVKNGDPSHGKQLFLANPDPSKPACSSCHTLADAKSTGTLGPNLDDAFSSDKQQGFTTQSIEDLIRGQIAYPEKPMPANLLTGQDANDVATYIAKCSGNPTCGVTPTKSAPAPSASTPTTTSKSPAPASPLAAGKQVFETAGCASCHTLKDAGATGTVGPNLDQLKPPDARVVRQVTNGGKIMPAFKGRLSPAQIQAVAKYVSSVAGK